MIYTVTVNPALDYVIQLNEIKENDINRTKQYSFLAGGKGINVSQVLNQLNVDNVAWGFVGGFTGKELVRQLNVKQIDNDLVTISGTTRVNVKVHTHGNNETEINADGPDITKQEIDAFKIRLNDLKKGDVVVMSGSLTPSLGADFYQSLLPTIKEAGAEFVVDTTGQALLDTLEYKPLVVKPNNHELAALFNTEFKNDTELIAAGKKLLDLGAQHVMVSLGARGGYLITKDHVYYSKGAVGTPVNTVGAGDSMIAGFVGTYMKDHDAKEAFKVGMACGAATAFTTDIAVRSQINVLIPEIKITEVAGK